MFIFAANLQNIFKWENWVHHYIKMSQLCIEQNESSKGRQVPVMILCNHSRQCTEGMQSSKLLQPIAVGWLYLSSTGREEHNRLRHCSLPTLWFFKICRFWYSSLSCMLKLHYFETSGITNITRIFMATGKKTNSHDSNLYFYWACCSLIFCLLLFSISLLLLYG